MTLKVRNRANLFLIILCVLVAGFSFVIVFWTDANGFWIDPPEALLQNNNFSAIIMSIFSFVLLSVVLLIYIKLEFEKTQSTEVVYFLIFCVACSLESVRIIFPAFNLWTHSQSLAATVTRLLLVSRLLAPMSLLFSAVYNKVELRQYTEQNIIILLVLSAFLASVYPLNSQEISCFCYIECGQKWLFMTMRYSLFVLTIATQVVDFLQDSAKYSFPYGLTLLCTGYMFLCKALNYLYLAIGVVFFLIGAYLYLRDLHRQYMWGGL